MTLELTSFEAATSALCALSALVWMLSVVLAVTAPSDRSISVGDRLDLAGGVGRGRGSELCASRALLEDGSGGIGADRGQRALDVDRQRLDVVGGSEDAVTSVFWASRAPVVIDSAVALPAIDSERCTSAASDLTWLAASADAVTSVLWASRAPESDGLGGGGAGDRQRTLRRRRPAT